MAAVLRAGAFLAAVLRAGAFLAAVFFAGAFLAAVFFATAMDNPSSGFNADLNAEPVANRTPLDAGIDTAAPVRGFLPTRGARSVGENVPKPTTVTLCPDRTSEITVSNRTSTMSSTVLRASCVDSVTAWTS